MITFLKHEEVIIQKIYFETFNFNKNLGRLVVYMPW